MTKGSGYPEISDYALIGDSRGAALISKEGSVDWLCAPRFDAPSVFNALLDRWRGGRLAVRALGARFHKRRYLAETCVLETELRGPGCRVRITDFCPALAAADKRRYLLPLWSLCRFVEVLEGEAEIEALFKPRPGDAERTPAVELAGDRVARCAARGGLFTFSADGPLRSCGGEAFGRWRLRTGETRALWFGYDEAGPAVIGAPALVPELLRETEAYWRGWAGGCRSCLGRASIVRSALTLKLLSFPPSGAIVAAPTTSLPEQFGGERNWDYRFCWLRDASLTARIFFDLGYTAEARSFVDWMVFTTVRTRPELKVFYDLFGEPSRPEHELPALEGYGGAGPVRAGNGADQQYQLDVYGEVLDSVRMYVEAGATLDREMRAAVRGLADYAARSWTRPDHGIWEIRGPRRHYVHSKVMCWAALKHAESIAHALGRNSDVERWRGARAAIARAVNVDGWSETRGSFVQRFGAQDLDATSLLLVAAGFCEPPNPRAAWTVDAIRAELEPGDGLVRRYINDDRQPGDEGAFLPCSFWLVEALAALGRIDEAEELFERLEKFRNDVGLFSEEIEPRTGRALGNFPQAFTHLAHVRAALRLEQARKGAAPPKGSPVPRGHQ